MAKTKKKKGRGDGDLAPVIYKGLSDKRMAKGSATNRCRVDKGKTVTVQFLNAPDDMREFDQHQFQDGGKWQYVPCIGKDCPLCDDDDDQVSRTHYRFICNVWNFSTKRVEILEGPKTLAGRIKYRWKKRKDSFLKRTYDVSKFDTQPVEWDVESADDNALPSSKRKGLKLYDLDKDIKESLQRWFGDNTPEPKTSKTALDDDDYEEDDEYDEDDLDEMKWSEVAKIAKGLKIKTKDDDGDKIPKAKLIKRILKKQAA